MADTRVGFDRAGAGTSGHGHWRAAEQSSDLVRLGLAALLFVLTVLAIQRDTLSAFERDVFRLINDLPAWMLVPIWPIEQMGARLAPFVIGGLVIVALRRVRLGLSIMVAGTGAWLVAQALKTVVERPRPAGFLDDLPAEWSSGGPGFVSGHTAVVTAMAAVTAPYLPRRWRRLVWTLPVVVGFARIYGGAHLPLDVVGGFAVGWFVGTLVHLLVGTTRPRRTPDVVAEMLGRLGVDVATVEPADVHARVSHPFRVTTAEGDRLFVKVLDPDPRSTDWVLRIARVFAAGERRDFSALASLPAAADHEAAVTLAAHAAGVRVPDVVLARGNGTAAVVVLEDVAGQDLTAISPEAVSDEVLRELWQQVGRLRRARIAHRDLVRANVVLDRYQHPWLVDFRDAEVGASDHALDADVAELMASLAAMIGPERAVASASTQLGADAVSRALPDLEFFALSPRTRQELRARPGLLDAVRAAAGGVPDPSGALLSVRRIWIPAIVAAAGYALLLSLAGWGAVMDTVADAQWRWLVFCGAVFGMAWLLSGAAITVAVRRRVAVGRSAAAAAVASSAEVLAGPAARRTHLDRYVRSCGARGHEPASAVGLVMSAEALASLLMLVGATGVAWGRDLLAPVGAPPVPALMGLAAIAALGGVAVRRLTRHGLPRGARRRLVRHALHAARRSPGRAMAVLTTMVGAELALVVALAAALEAMGASEALAVIAAALAGTRVLMVLLGLSDLPLVGETACSAALCALGVPPVQAVLAVLVYAFYRYWATGAVSAFAGPRLAPVHVPDPNSSVTSG